MNSLRSVGDLSLARALQDFRGGDALVLQRREAARKNRFADQRDRHAQVERADHGPLAGAFLAGGVENLVDQRLAVVVLLGEDSAVISIR